MRGLSAGAHGLTAAVILVVAACHSSPPPAPPPMAPAPPPAVEAADASAPAEAVDASAPAEAADASVPAEAAVADAPPAIPTRVNPMRLRAGQNPPRGRAGAHGAAVWIVVLGVGDSGSAELRSLFERLNRERYAAALGEPNCIVAPERAPAELPSGEEARWLTVEFATERDARRFAAALTDPPLWVGQGRVLCAD